MRLHWLAVAVKFFLFAVVVKLAVVLLVLPLLLVERGGYRRPA
jgi:hypothetical protein